MELVAPVFVVAELADRQLAVRLVVVLEIARPLVDHFVVVLLVDLPDCMIDLPYALILY